MGERLWEIAQQLLTGVAPISSANKPRRLP